MLEIKFLKVHPVSVFPLAALKPRSVLNFLMLLSDKMYTLISFMQFAEVKGWHMSLQIITASHPFKIRHHIDLTSGNSSFKYFQDRYPALHFSKLSIWFL